MIKINRTTHLISTKKIAWIFSLSCVLFLNVIFPLHLEAQGKSEISENEKKQAIDSISKLLDNQYIYPDVAKKIIKEINSNFTKGTYKSINNPIDFANKLTDDVISISNDKHFHVFYDPEWIAASKKVLTKKDSIELDAKDFPNAKMENFGFREVKILQGNIGYLKLTNFWNPFYGGETAVAAMNFLSNTDAVIIDLRDNGGGYGSMVQLLSSYFFDTSPVLLVEMYNRKLNKTTQDYILPYVTGKRRPDLDVYILINNKTFSAAESFAYFFKNRKRATIIGEKSGGGAHPVDHLAATDKFSLFLPNMMPIDPITKTNWEVTGVKPDLEVNSKDALITAQIKALEKLSVTNKDTFNIYLWQLDGIKAKQKPIKLDESVLKSYEGSYRERKLSIESGSLYYQKNNGEKLKLIPINPTLFMFDELDYIRLKIITENGKAIGLMRLYNDGTSGQDSKNKE
jgi:hypothetical protein